MRSLYARSSLHPDTVNWQARVNAVGGRIAKKTLLHTDRLIKYCYAVGLRDVSGTNHKLKFWLPLATDTFEGLFIPVWHPILNAACVNNNFIAADYLLANGLQGNDSDKYIDSLVSTNLFDNSIYLAYHSATESFSPSPDIGAYSPPFFSSFHLKYVDSNSYFGQREVNTLSVAAPSSLGFFAGFRVNEINYFYQDLTKLGENMTPNSSITIPDLNYFLFTRNDANVPFVATGRRLCCFFIGDNVTLAQHEKFAVQQGIWDAAVRT